MSSKQKNNFKVQVDRFSDIEILRYEVPGFEDLSLKQKKFIYYLSEAALSGRDIIYDQNYKYNLTVRSTLNNIVQNFNGNKSSKQWAQFIEYAKRVWFSNGIHHHYSTLKILPGFDQSYLTKLVEKIDSNPDNINLLIARSSKEEELYGFSSDPQMFNCSQNSAFKKQLEILNNKRDKLLSN